MAWRPVVITLVGLAMHAPGWAQNADDVAHRGRAILVTNCSRCHAVDRTGASRHPEAPAFRTLGQRYPIDSLAEALAEGLMTGHPDMPEFVFEIDEVRAILAYLHSIQIPKAALNPGDQ